MSDNVTPAATEEAVILVSFPHQLLHALCALEHDRTQRGIDRSARTIVAVWSYQPAHHTERSQVRSFFESASKVYPFIDLLFFSLEERKGPLSPYRQIKKRSEWLRRRLPPVSARAFYYAHDASADHTAQVFMQALQPLNCICYGDVPGFLYPGSRPRLGPLPLRPSSLKTLFWLSRMRGIKTWLSAHKAYVAIIFDSHQDNDALPVAYTIPPEILIRHIEALKAAMPIVSTFESQLLERADTPLRILILGNFSKSRLMSEAAELALYEAICENHLRPGDTLILKKHPGSTLGFLKALELRLHRYNTLRFPDEVEYLPIELFTQLLRRADILSVSSASALFSIIPHTRSFHVLTTKHINSLFYAHQRAYMLDANHKILTHILSDHITDTHL